MTLKNLLPQEFYDHLDAGGIVVVIATPVNSTQEPISLAFTKTHLYHHKPLPSGSWISDEPIARIRDGVTAEEIVTTHLKVIMSMANEANAMIQIDFELATPKTALHN